MPFLDDAHRLGLLRTVGPIYQFRHAEFQDHLAVLSRPPVPEDGSENAPESSPRRRRIRRLSQPTVRWIWPAAGIFGCYDLLFTKNSTWETAVTAVITTVGFLVFVVLTVRIYTRRH